MSESNSTYKLNKSNKSNAIDFESVTPSSFISPFQFNPQEQEWKIEAMSLNQIAEQYGTPCYVYSKTAIETAYNAFHNAFQGYPHHIHYAVKANSNLAILNVLARLGAGFDIVSQGELERVLKAGGKPENIIFSGVGKTKEELLRAISVNVGCINVESESELLLLYEMGQQLKKQIPVTLRINPNIDAKSHPYISTGLKENKFGILQEQALALVKRLHEEYHEHLKFQGLACHIGSQILEFEPFLAALDTMLELSDTLEQQGIRVETVNMGGGLGIAYRPHDSSLSPMLYVETLVGRLKARQHSHQNNLQNRSLKPIKIILEPGRSIVGQCGVLLTRVHHIKETAHKNFAIVDAGMNDLLRPALYQAYQDIQVIKIKNNSSNPAEYDIVGPVCETADFLGHGRMLGLEQGTLLGIFSAGAYGFSMSSNYNSRPRPPEIMVSGDQSFLVRPRETYAELFQSELMLPDCPLGRP